MIFSLDHLIHIYKTTIYLKQSPICIEAMHVYFNGSEFKKVKESESHLTYRHLKSGKKMYIPKSKEQFDPATYHQMLYYTFIRLHEARIPYEEFMPEMLPTDHIIRIARRNGFYDAQHWLSELAYEALNEEGRMFSPLSGLTVEDDMQIIKPIHKYIIDIAPKSPDPTWNQVY